MLDLHATARTVVPFLVWSLIAVPSHAQTALPDAQTGVPVFQLRARTVVVDVVVTDKNDQPIPGLTRQDFTVTESGQPQTITYFEEHTGVPAPEAAPEAGPATPLQPDVFSNVPKAKVTDSVNVLLLDSLNTPLEDQAYVRAETMKYLKNVEPGTRLAIFTLGNELRFIQGFTADAGVLAAALNSKTASPQLSSLLRTNATIAGEATQADMTKQAYLDSNTSGYGGDPDLLAALEGLQQFQREKNSSDTAMRVQQTLFALQQLARYLAGVPGRKNVIWFSGAFPLQIFPTPPNSEGPGGTPVNDPERFESSRDFIEEVKKTDNLLAAAQVAMYPIAAQGLVSDAYNDAEHGLSGVSSSQEARQDQIQGLRSDADSRNAAHMAMQTIAHETGGEAFYNTNGIKDAVARVMRTGTRYYTIAYTPTNKEMNGAFRPIKVTVNVAGSHNLAYRPGYYSTDERTEKATLKAEIKDPLHPYMGHGMPDSTQIAYTLNLVPSATQPAAGAAPAGDNPALKGPVTRYTATVWMPVASLRMSETPEGLHEDSIEAAFVVYDHTGKALNWIVRTVNLSLKPERYTVAQQVGIPLRVEIDAPAGRIYLRTGLYENSSHAAGTLEVPLSEVTPVTVAAK